MSDLKRAYQNEGDIPKELKDYYKKSDDGWTFSGFVDEGGGDSGEDWKAERAEWRKNNLSLINENKSLKGRLEALENQFKGIDPEDIKGALGVMAQMKVEEEKELLKKGKIDEVVERRMKTAMDEAQKQLQIKDEAMKKAMEESKAMRSKLNEYWVDREIQMKLSDAKVAVQEGALPDIMSRAKMTWQFTDDGKPVPMEMDPMSGKMQVRYGKSGQQLTMDEFISDMISKAPHLFKPSTGGNAPGGDRGRGSYKSNEVIDFYDSKSFQENIDDIAAGKKKATLKRD